MKVVITDSIPEIAERLISKAGFEVTILKRSKSFSKEKFINAISNADGIISLLSDKIDKEIIDKLHICKVIANYAVGYNNIDIDYAKSKKIIVTNTPDVLTDATADLSIALILACARRFHEGEKMIRQKKFKGWAPKLLLGFDLKGKTLGIVGAGRIGQATAIRAQSFGMKILYYNRTKKEDFEKQTKAKRTSLDQLLKTSDVISLHLSLNSKTKLLLNRDKLKLLKPSSILINTARGEILDEKFLIELLKKKKIFAAGFDVYQNEPDINPDLLKLENVVLLPHLGSATIETRNSMAELAAKNIISVLQNRKPFTPVN